MTTEHPSKTPSHRTGLFALLRGPLHLKGTSAPNTGHRSGTPARLILVTLATLGALGFAATPALAVAPVLGEASVENVAATSATLLAQVNPEGTETTYRFEYGTSASYGESIPVPGGLAGAGTSVVEVQGHPQDLLAGTEYHYRVVAESAGGKSEGPDQTFTTRPPGSELVLPDNRAWEQVSPVEKNGEQVIMVNGSVSEAAEDGSAITYLVSGPLGAGVSAAPESTQILSRRGASGWSSRDIMPPEQEPVSPTSNTKSEYSLFSSNLAYAILEPSNVPLLSSEVTERDLYRRSNATDEYQPLVTPANTLPETKIGGNPQDPVKPVEVTAATPDLSHIIIKSEAQMLTEQGQGRPSRGPYLYEWSAGQLQLIDELPAGDTAEEHGAEIGRGANSPNLRHAISSDGSRVFWTMGGQLFIRNVPAAETISIVGDRGSNGEAEEFQEASSDGSIVFYAGSYQEFGVLYRGLYAYDVESGTPTPVTVPQNSGDNPEFKGTIIGASEDGSYVYLVAGGVLSENENAMGEKAVAGADNLYVLHSELAGGATEWKTSFIAQLSEEDHSDWKPHYFEEGESGRTGLEQLTASVAPNGRYLVFMSNESLTGYDNVDANSGQRDEEVYQYDAQSGRLACVSCDPTGARPVGRNESGEFLADLSGAFGENQWVAASVPGWLETRAYKDPAYQPRYLSDNGRVFFDSPDALVPQDTGGSGQVYEYEPEGVGDCAGASVTYSVKAGGCIALISGGRGGQESAFVDASASGNDVFFVTAEGLVAGDTDGLYDMYDAHVCNAEAPCPPVAVAVASPPCDTADSCRAAPTPQPAVFGAPASATFSGSGDVTPAAVAPTKTKTGGGRKRCGKHEQLRRGKCVKTKARKRAKAKKAASDKRRVK
jgi:hypothetical protein